ncbi:MAG TPA: squalene synthase HpnC [Bryobacterales bacterium]|nr:squalene synthase HpnC [Bryobacterales bacterium]
MRFLLPAEFVSTPGAATEAWELTDSLRYTRWLARHHYENFHVVSFLLPRRLHQDFFNIYAFCRWADDLGDEIGDPKLSLQLLGWWREELGKMYRGEARHPVYVALRQTVGRHSLPEEPFRDLIRAFVQDQTVTRYQTYAQLLDYCVCSANPVGRLVLHLCGYRDAGRRQFSDATCTALQLANHWQDVTRDLEKGRVYLPLEDMAAHGCRLEDLEQRRCNKNFRALMRDLVNRAHLLFLEGLPLVEKVDRRLAVDLELFSRGGLAILEKIRRQDYNVLERRPALGKRERLALLARAVWRVGVGRRSLPAAEAADACR